MKSVFEKYLSNTPKYANQIQIQIQIFHLVVFQIQIQIQIQIFAYLNTNTNTNTYLTPALLLGYQKQPTGETQGPHVGDTFDGSLHQQGIYSLLKVLSAVPGLETDALMGELRSLLECNAHPVLDDASGPAVAQQTPPVRGKVC